jgi:hypothetical protein
MPLKTQQYELSNWQGMDRWTPETECDPHWWQDLQNMDCDDCGVTAKRRGSVATGNTFSSTINLIYDWQKQDGFDAADDISRTVIISGTTLSVIQFFGGTGPGTISATFTVTNTKHHAITDDLGVCYITNENGGVPKMLCKVVDVGYVFQDATLTAPSTISVSAGGAYAVTYSGTFYACYSYVDVYGNESPLSPESEGVFLTNQVFDITITGSTDSTVDYMKIYVLGPSMSEYQFGGTVSNTTATITYPYYLTMSDLMAGDVPPDYLVDCPKGKYVTIYQDMLLLGGDLTVPDTVWASNRQFHRQWSDNFARCVSGDGQPIRGFGGSYDRMMVVKSDSLFLCEGDHQDTFRTRAYSNEYGAVGQSAVAIANNHLAMFYDDGLYVDDGSQPTEASRKVLNYLRTLDYRNIVPVGGKPSTLVIDNYKYYRQIFISTREYAVAAGANDVMLIWNYLRNTWTKYTGNVAVALGAISGSGDYEYLYGGNASGKVFIFSPPNNYLCNDDKISSTASTTISCIAETPWMNFAKLLNLPDWERTRIVPRYIEIYASGEPKTGEDKVDLDLGYYVDFNKDTCVTTFSTQFTAHAWPTVRPYKQSIYYGGKVGTFRWVKWRFEHAYLGQHIRIHKIVFGFKTKPSLD